jgi:hypothetical protein
MGVGRLSAHSRHRNCTALQGTTKGNMTIASSSQGNCAEGYQSFSPTLLIPVALSVCTTGAFVVATTLVDTFTMGRFFGFAFAISVICSGIAVIWEIIAVPICLYKLARSQLQRSKSNIAALICAIAYLSGVLVLAFFIRGAGV